MSNEENEKKEEAVVEEVAEDQQFDGEEEVAEGDEPISMEELII